MIFLINSKPNKRVSAKYLLLFLKSYLEEILPARLISKPFFIKKYCKISIFFIVITRNHGNEVKEMNNNYLLLQFFVQALENLLAFLEL